MAVDLAGLDEAALLEEFKRQKGLASFEDEEVAEPMRQLAEHHRLSVHVEHCTCIRPSHHLRGSREKYTSYFTALEAALQPLQVPGQIVARNAATATHACSSRGARQGEGYLQLVANSPEWQGMPGLEEQQAPKSRPGSAGSVASHRAPLQPRLPPATLDAYGFPSNGPPRWPRVGSFEVSYALTNTTSKVTYGPFLCFSKLQSERRPRAVE